MPTRPAQANPNILAGAMIVGAVMIAIIGAMTPSLLELTGPEASWVPLVFYAVAAIDILLALRLRSRLIRAQRSGNPGGTIQRQ
ncbi:MAG: hypothetical protein JNN33_10190 [Rhodospirillaceae bacterium]|nr:hypothetical protein [Rhodospirillaceae bacterium]